MPTIAAGAITHQTCHRCGRRIYTRIITNPLGHWSIDTTPIAEHNRECQETR